MTVLHVLIGAAGTGKSTVAQKLIDGFKTRNRDYCYISTDKIREELCGTAADQTRNREVFEIAHARLEQAFEYDCEIIFDATNLTPKARKPLNKIAEKHNAFKVAYFMETSFDEALRRNASRERKVPEDIIEKHFEKLTYPHNEDYLVYKVPQDGIPNYQVGKVS